MSQNLKDNAPEDLVLRDDLDGICILTISRPDALNAMNRPVQERLNERLDEIEFDDTVDVIVITGSGEKSFVAGADIQELNRRLPYDALLSYMQRLYARIEQFSKPTVAAINGYAFGGGCELATVCDVRLASKNALFALPETGLGVLPGAGGTQRVAKFVNLGLAMDMILSGRRLTGEDAFRWGLVSELVEPDELMAAAIKKAKQIQSKGPLGIKLAKQVVQAGFKADQETGLLLERLAMAVAYSTEEKAEGTAAFIEKRTPDFDAVHHDRVIHRNHHAQFDKP